MDSKIRTFIFRNVKTSLSEKNLLFDIIFPVIEKGFKITVGIVIVGLIAKHLGPSDYGKYIYYYSIIGLLGPISSLGIESYTVKFLVEKRYTEKEVIGASFFIRMITSIVIILLSYIVLSLLNIENINLHILIISITFLYSFHYGNYLFQSLNKNKYTSAVNFSSFILISLIRVLFVIYQFDFKSFVYLVVLENFFLAALFVLTTKRKGSIGLFSLNFDWNIIKDLTFNSIPLGLSLISVMIYMKIDRFMIIGILDDKSLASYDAAARISETSYFIAAFISQTFFPIIVRSLAKSNFEFKEACKSLFSILIYTGIVIGMTLFFFSKFLILTIYGDEYSDAITVLKIFSLNLVFAYLNYGNIKWFIATNRQMQAFYRSLLTMIFNVLGNFILIPNFGIVGAAYATCISYVAGLFLSMYFSKGTRENFNYSIESFNPINAIRGLKRLAQNN